MIISKFVDLVNIKLRSAAGIIKVFALKKYIFILSAIKVSTWTTDNGLVAAPDICPVIDLQNFAEQMAALSGCCRVISAKSVLCGNKN